MILSASVTFGHDDKELSDTAYCVGVLRHSIAARARLGADSDTPSRVQLLTQKSAMVGSAVGKNGLDAVTIRQLFSVGRADAELCWDQVDMCILGAATDLDACMRPVKDACLRTAACER